MPLSGSLCSAASDSADEGASAVRREERLLLAQGLSCLIRERWALVYRPSFRAGLSDDTALDQADTGESLNLFRCCLTEIHTWRAGPGLGIAPTFVPWLGGQEFQVPQDLDFYGFQERSLRSRETDANERDFSVCKRFQKSHFPPKVMWQGRILYVQGNRENRNSAEEDRPAKRKRHPTVSR